MAGKVLRLSVFGKFQSRIPNCFLPGQAMHDSVSFKFVLRLNPEVSG